MITMHTKPTNMKAIIYAGISLFSVATVYGLVDYYSSSKKGTMDKLYVEKEAQPLTEIEETKTAVIPVAEIEAEKTEPAKVTAKVKSTKIVRRMSKKLDLKEFSRARIPDPEQVKAMKKAAAKEEEEKKQ